MKPSYRIWHWCPYASTSIIFCHGALESSFRQVRSSASSWIGLSTGLKREITETRTFYGYYEGKVWVKHVTKFFSFTFHASGTIDAHSADALISNVKRISPKR